MAEETMKDFEKEIEESFNNRNKLEDADATKWERFQAMMESKEQFKVKISQVVKGGCVAYVDDVRGFIPASHLSTAHVENLDEYLNKNIDVVIITVEPEKKRLAMSHREIERAAQRAERAKKREAIQEGAVLTGKVDSLKDYGAFIDLGDGISGLLHVSQISWKRVKSPAAVLQEGQEVEVKVISTENGKISLSMKALQEAPAGMEEQAEERSFRRPRREAAEDDGFKYEEKGQATTSLGDLLKGIKL